MIKINKSREPLELTEYKLSESLDVKNPLSDKEINFLVRRRLYEDQKGICAYCMVSLKEDLSNTVIEHIKPKSSFQELARDYNNLLLTCNNNEDHCDKSKADRLLNRVGNVITTTIESSVHYKFNGEIFSSNNLINEDIENILNLNKDSNLCRNREQVISEAERTLLIISNSHSNKNVYNRKLEKGINKIKRSSKFPSYVGAMIYTLINNFKD